MVRLGRALLLLLVLAGAVVAGCAAPADSHVPSRESESQQVRLPRLAGGHGGEPCGSVHAWREPGLFARLSSPPEGADVRVDSRPGPPGFAADVPEIEALWGRATVLRFADAERSTPSRRGTELAVFPVGGADDSRARIEAYVDPERDAGAIYDAYHAFLSIAVEADFETRDSWYASFAASRRDGHTTVDANGTERVAEHVYVLEIAAGVRVADLWAFVRGTRRRTSKSSFPGKWPIVGCTRIACGARPSG